MALACPVNSWRRRSQRRVLANGKSSAPAAGPGCRVRANNLPRRNSRAAAARRLAARVSRNGRFFRQAFEVTFNPRNILVIDFGQLGDVVMSLPALRAIREKFPHARLTIAVGKPGAEIVNLSGYANETIEVDRVALRDGFKPLSILKVFDIVKDVRRRKFDFVIDLHSFSETNLLGFFSRAPQRLFARRPGRSLDFLASFNPKPPIDRNDPKQHLVDRYLDVLKPLGIKDAPRIPKLLIRPDDDRAVDVMLRKARADAGSPLIGVYPVADHPGRCWPIETIPLLTDFLIRNDNIRSIVFVGPEERHLVA